MGILRVRNVAQKVLWEEELSGQLSDGQWENSTPSNHWLPWCRANVVIDAENPGRDFYANRQSYNFTAPDLLAVVQDRMISAVQLATGDVTYDVKRLKADLNDLKKVIKLQVSSAAPVPTQPQEYKAARVVDGYAREFRTFVPTEDDPEAVRQIAARAQEQAAYRLRSVEKKIAEKQAELAKLEADAAELKAKLGMLV